MTSRRAFRSSKRKSRNKNYRGQHLAGADRRAENLPINALVRAIVVEDPYGGVSTVLASIRDDPLGHLHDRGRIDDIQFKAGRDYQNFYERAEVSGVQAMDTTKEPVDGGNVIPDPLSSGMLAAADQLAYLDRRLGDVGKRLCRAFLIERMFLNQIAESLGMPSSERAINYIGKRVAECLETLAAALGYTQQRRKIS